MRKTIDLKKWHFKIERLHFEKDVMLPHTWNVDEQQEVQIYRGTAEYKTEITVETLENKTVRLYFGCAYHTCSVSINGQFAGKHTGSGYTPFELDITKYLTVGKNEVSVTVDNRKSADMLPYKMNFDWADDGGLTRDVLLNIYDSDDILNAELTTEITNMNGSFCSGNLNLKIEATPQDFQIDLVDYETDEVVLSHRTFVNKFISIPFTDLKLWNIDTPHLYWIKILTKGDRYTFRTGFRTIKVKNAKVLLNGKEIYLKGCEWMPGSSPDYGMAEPIEVSRKYLSLMKEAGCVFTRFHWQQDDALFDWCDENGLLVQEEIPYWGNPKKATQKQFEIAKNQAADMVHYHAHHPSIICWGVGNELGARCRKTIKYVEDMYGYFKSLDGSRLVNYVSNTLHEKKQFLKDDATLHGDIAMWNDYLGLWLKCKDVDQTIHETYERCGNMPSLVSEFGLCEPFFKGGDKRRAEILKQRVALYKTLPNMVGYVWFSLNDYRTHCGEEGKGKMKQRVHGSTDLYGTPKPSYYTLKEFNYKNE